jgi:hypothetical protein
MNTLETLYFPDTVLTAQQQFPLALFFSVIHLLQPVEPDGATGTEPSSAPGSHPFMETGFCQVHTPSPLGADRNRFLHLLHDIRTRKDSYVEQLSYLSLASLSAPATRGDQSKQTIITSLLQGMDEKNGPLDEEARQALWQARLVLSMAEILDREEEELALQLATIDDQEIALFRQLQGEIRESGEEDAAVEDPFHELLELRQKMSQPRPGMIKNRLRAWSRLYLSGPLPEALAIWTTCRREAADILLERYEQECGQPPLLVFQVDLPAAIEGDRTEMGGEVAQFREAMQPQMAELTAAMAALVAGKSPVMDVATSLLPQAEQWQDHWNTSLESAFPARQYRRTPLSIYLLAGMACSELIAPAGQGASPAPAIGQGLLAVCG